MSRNSAFSQTASNTVANTVLYDLGQVTKGTDKTYLVKVPSPALTGIPTTTKLKAVISGYISDLEGTAGELTISVKNTTSGDGTIKEEVYDTEGEFFEGPSMDCFGDDILEYTFSYTATEAGQKATFTSNSTTYLK